MTQRRQSLSPTAKVRLRKLVRFVREHVRNRSFEMDQFGVPRRGQTTLSCKTSGCMAGWATVAVPASKLHFAPTQRSHPSQGRELVRVAEYEDNEWLLDQSTWCEGFLPTAFDITEDQAFYLFLDGDFFDLDRLATCDRFDLFIANDGRLPS